MSTVTSNGMRELLIHDMRTPLATISGYAQLLHRRAARHNSDIHQLVNALEHIERAAVRVETLLDELAQLPEDDDEPRTEKLDLVDLVRRVSADTNTIGRPRVVVLPSVPELIGEWNARAIEHLVANLLGNALKCSTTDNPAWVYPPVGPNRSVLIRSGGWPNSTNVLATVSTSAVGPHTMHSGRCSGTNATSRNMSRSIRLE